MRTLDENVTFDYFRLQIPAVYLNCAERVCLLLSAENNLIYTNQPFVHTHIEFS